MKGKNEPTVAILTENLSGQLLHFLCTWLGFWTVGLLGNGWWARKGWFKSGGLKEEWKHFVFGAIVKKPVSSWCPWATPQVHHLWAHTDDTLIQAENLPFIFSPWWLLFLGLQCGSAWGCVSMAIVYTTLCWHSIAGDRKGRPYSVLAQLLLVQRSKTQFVKRVSWHSVSFLESPSDFRHAEYMRSKEHKSWGLDGAGTAVGMWIRGEVWAWMTWGQLKLPKLVYSPRKETVGWALRSEPCRTSTATVTK